MAHAALLRKALSAVTPAVGWKAKFLLVIWVWLCAAGGGWLCPGQAVSLGCPALRGCCPAPARAALLEGSRGRLWPNSWPLSSQHRAVALGPVCRCLPPCHVRCHVPADQGFQEPLLACVSLSCTWIMAWNPAGLWLHLASVEVGDVSSALGASESAPSCHPSGLLLEE